jgi:hypothetical protein
MSEQSAREDGSSLVIPSLLDRLRGFELPNSHGPDPQDYNPTMADADTLLRIGLPPRPDKYRHPELHKLWINAFGRTLRFVRFTVPRPFEGPDYRPFLRRERRGPPATRFETSRNWSGAYIEPSAGMMFAQVWGQWTVPTPHPPPGATVPEGYQCSTWIGLDGQRRYRNSSLPQIGTRQAVTVAADGTQSYMTDAWVQWWDQYDKKSEPVPIHDFPVDHGNIISCVLTVLDEHHVLLNIVNQSTKPPTFTPIKADAPTPAGSRLPLSISGATAEWIMERPAIPEPDTPDNSCQPYTSDNLYLLPDYGSMDFVGCYAVEAFEGDVSPVEQTLKTPRFIRMYEVRPNPQRTAYISMPMRIDDTSFRVAYGDFRD